MLYPLTFHPILKERVWGGRNLERLYHKALPAHVPIGESWEISDRPGDVSVIAHGPLAGKDLRWLMEHHENELLGSAKSQAGRFPLLVKILDAREKLSLQVHPPAEVAAKLHGEPKTEMWYFTDTTPAAEIFVGLKRGITRAEFERKIRDGSVADCFHRVAVWPGDAMFLPSGRVHALGGGNVLFEVQQNSDTTYRVFDWNRVGLDGKPRELHIAEALALINFEDYEPALVRGQEKIGANFKMRLLVDDSLFKVDAVALQPREFTLPRTTKPQIVGLLDGHISVIGDGHAVQMEPGQFCLVPASLKTAQIGTQIPSTFLLVECG